MSRLKHKLLGDDPDEIEIEESAESVERLNRIHAFVAGKGVIREERDGGFQIESVRMFHDFYADDGVWSRGAKGGDVFTSVAKIWMQSPLRRKYSRIVLDPTNESRGVYNLWRGFSHKPSAKASCERYLDHLFYNVCRGDKALYRWLVGWMAHLIQRPWEKPGTALVFKGKPGVGKSSVGQHLGALIARHYATVYTPRGLVGQFNAHMATAILVQIEEGFWAGDKAAEGALKHLITGPTIQLEKKGVDAIKLPSFHRYLITSNERWTVPARHDERRYAIFDVSDARAKDGEYFGAIQREMEAGGYAALMRHLLDFDLSSVDVRAIPHTEALTAEKITGLRGLPAWWHDVLAAGELPPDRLSRFDEEPAEWRSSSISIRADDLRDAYETWIRARRHQGDVLSATGFGIEFRDVCPGANRTQRRAERGQRTRFYELPPLTECRLAFGDWLGSKVDWS